MEGDAGEMKDNLNHLAHGEMRRSRNRRIGTRVVVKTVNGMNLVRWV